MIDIDKINKLLDDKKTFWEKHHSLDGIPSYHEKYVDPLMVALGDDEEDIKNFLRECSKDDLFYLSEMFEYIYGKFLNDDMYDFLDEMEIKAGLHN